MAWTEGVAAFSEFQLRVVRGDTKQHHVIGTYPAGAFQGTFADGFDANKAIRVGAAAAVLGCRGDVLYLLSTHTGKVDLSETDATNCVALQMADIQNVPQDVQLRGYGKFSPFASPAGMVSRGSMVGISKELKMVANSKIGTSTSINMNGDSRFVLADDDSATSAFSTSSPLVTFTPGQSDVFLVRPHYIINVDVDTFGS